jgi:hypothetical protein
MNPDVPPRSMMRLADDVVIACDDEVRPVSSLPPAGAIWRGQPDKKNYSWCKPAAQVDGNEEIPLTPKAQMYVQGLVAYQKGLIKGPEPAGFLPPRGIRWKPRTYDVKPEMKLVCNSTFHRWDCDLLKRDKTGNYVNWTAKAHHRRFLTREHFVRGTTIEVGDFSVDDVSYKTQNKAWIRDLSPNAISKPIEVTFPAGGVCSRFYYGFRHGSSWLDCKSGIPTVEIEEEGGKGSVKEKGTSFEKRIAMIEPVKEAGTENCSKACSVGDPDDVSSRIKVLGCCIDSIKTLHEMQEAGVPRSQIKMAKSEENAEWCATFVKSWLDTCNPDPDPYNPVEKFPVGCDLSTIETNPGVIKNICYGFEVSMIGTTPDDLRDVIAKWEKSEAAATRRKQKKEIVNLQKQTEEKLATQQTSTSEVPEQPTEEIVIP